jgi:SAM-dependent methyltransferase
MPANDDPVSRRYLEGDFAVNNPDWDAKDSPWKAVLVAELLLRHRINPGAIADIGCGAGGVIVELQVKYPAAEFIGYDIAPHCSASWEAHSRKGITFIRGDFLEVNRKHYDLLLVMDVVEHLGDPFTFLFKLRDHAHLMIFHFPLDLSASSVLREAPLLEARARTGHIHYFTKGLVLALLGECGYEVIEARYTGASLKSPNRKFRTRAAGIIRRMAYAMNRDLGVRLLGGETLLVLARPQRAS